MFTVGFLKLLSTLPNHIAVWGNFPFKNLWNIIPMVTKISNQDLSCNIASIFFLQKKE